MHTSAVNPDRSRVAASPRRARRSAARWGGRVTAIAASMLASGALAGTAAATTPPTPPNASLNYTFQTLNNNSDPTFNQLLGINDFGLISGYFGSGQAGHPNKGYLLSPNGQAYVNENYPGSAQTQVTGLNNHGVTVGFGVDANGNNFGFYAIHGRHFHKVDFPTDENATPQVDQLLGVNDDGMAVGFFTDRHGINHGYSYDVLHHRYRSIRIFGDTNVTTAGINDLGDVAGFATNSAGTTEGFLKRSDGRLIKLNVPGASSTQALGVSNGDEVVGDYVVGTGNTATTHGFVWAPGFGFQTVEDPNGVGATTINGVNDRGALVGFYVDSAGNTDGLLATPQS